MSFTEWFDPYFYEYNFILRLLGVLIVRIITCPCRPGRGLLI